MKKLVSLQETLYLVMSFTNHLKGLRKVLGNLMVKEFDWNETNFSSAKHF